MRIVIDIDDTICDNCFRDYVHAKPYQDVIDKINLLHAEGHYIVLYTSRGMVSCKGDLKKIKKNNEEILTTWLRDHRVCYDELIFGKPLGDLYVDDKALNVVDFVDAPFYDLSGGSGLRTYRAGRMVIKELGSVDKVKTYKRWTQEASGYCLTPRLISTLYDSIYIDYVEGLSFNNIVNARSLERLISTVENFKYRDYDNFDIEVLLRQVEKNRYDETSLKVDFCLEQLKLLEMTLKENASFCHGDLTLSNIIVDKCGLYWFIDENWYPEASSYLLDFGKLRVSLDNYEFKFGISERVIDKHLKQVFDKRMKELGIYEEVVILEYMWLLRMYRYKQSLEEKKKVIDMLNELEKEQEWKIS